MRRLFFPLASIALLGLSSVGLPAHGQSSSERTSAQRKSQAFYFEAEKALGNGEYAAALEFAIESKNLLNADNALLASIRVRALAGLGQYQNAQNVLETYYSLNPKESLERLMSSTVVDIDRNIAAEQQREIDRVVRNEQLAIERAQREEQEAIFRVEEGKRLERERLEAERLAEIAAAEAVIKQAEEEAKFQAELKPWKDRFSRPRFGNAQMRWDEFKVIRPAIYPQADLRQFKRLAKQCHKTFKVNGGQDIDASPCVRNPPLYPPIFLEGDFSGYCNTNFDIDKNGHTTNIKIIHCTNDVLGAPTITAIRAFYYMPANVDGMIVDRRNVFSKIRYVLADDEENILPLPQLQTSKFELSVIEESEKN